MTILKYLRNMEKDAVVGNQFMHKGGSKEARRTKGTSILNFNCDDRKYEDRKYEDRKYEDINTTVNMNIKTHIINLRLFTDGSEIKDRHTYKTLAVGWGFVLKVVEYDDRRRDCDKFDKHSERIILKRNGALDDVRLANNQRAELMAILEGLKGVDGLHGVDGMKVDSKIDSKIDNKIDSKVDHDSVISLTLYTDSEYAMKCITTWSATWKRNGWVNSKNQPVKHQDVIKAILEIYQALSRRRGWSISVRHVRSHTGKTDAISRGNAEADELATNAARNYLLRQHKR
jgi:ribonuclease HI